MKRLTCALALAFCSLAAQADGLNVKEAAVTAAVTDSVSTYVALSAGAVEANPLVVTTPAGLVALAGLKWGLVEWVDASSMEKHEKEQTLRAMASLWGGVSVNNLLIAVSATGPVAVVGGVIAAVALWHVNYAEKSAAPAGQ